MPDRAAVDELVAQGAALSADEARALEQWLEDQPSDLDARARLLGHHDAVQGRTGLLASRNARLRHIQWLVSHSPDAPLLGHPLARVSRGEPAYYDLAQSWLELARRDPPRLAILENAASFFLFENSMLAEEMIERGEQHVPAHPRWARFRREMRAHTFAFPLHRASPDGKARRLAEIEELLRDGAIDHEWTIALLERASELAFAAGELSRARHHAELLLARTWDRDDDRPATWLRRRADIVHRCQILLGRIALRAGNVDRAKAHLALALRVGASPLLATLGPNMALAHELLLHGERDAVLRYFAACRAFWDEPALHLWEGQVRGGEIPDFGLHLLTF